MLSSFRTYYPAFDNYPDLIVEDALCEGEAECGGRGWGVYADECKNFKRRGIYLYAAHVLSANYSNAGGTTNAGSQNAVDSKSVGDESVSFNTGTINNAGDAWLASTSFGQQWMRLRRRAGMGARAV